MQSRIATKVCYDSVSMLELHRKILGDKGRNDAFYTALQQSIVPGTSIVCDIGSGTGFLSFLASRLGAKECHLFEQSEDMLLCQKLAQINEIENLTFHHEHSAESDKKIQADILVSETLGNYALEENIIESVEDAKRFLKKDAIIIPGAIEQFVCPVISKELYESVNVWDTIGYDLDFSAAKTVSLQNMYVRTIKPDQLLQQDASSQLWDTIDFSKTNESVRQATLSWTIKKPEIIYGFALWWNALLIKGVELSTSPFAVPTHWEQIFLPLLEPVKLSAGDKLELTLVSDTSPDVKVNLEWDVTQWSADGRPLTHQHLDMQQGFIAMHDDPA